MVLPFGGDAGTGLCALGSGKQLPEPDPQP